MMKPSKNNGIKLIQIRQILYFIEILYFLMIQGLCIDTSRQFILHPTPVANINIKKLSASIGLMLCVSEDEQYAYITSAQNGVHIVDLSQKELPQIISVIPTGYAQHCDVRNNYLFIADQQEGLVIADVSNKTSPKQLSQIAYQGIEGLSKAYQYVVLSQDSKYAFTLSYGFVFTYDVSTVSNPKFVFIVAAQNLFAPNSYRLKFDNSYQYIAVANHLSGVTIIDIRDISNQKIRFLQNPQFVTWDCLFSPDNTAFFALDIYFGVYYLNPSAVFEFTKDTDGMVTTLSFQNVIPSSDAVFMTMTMTRDGTHLLIGYRSMGLSLYKFAYNSVNSQFIYNSPIFVQHLHGDYMVLSMYSSLNNDQYIYVTDGITFTIYQSVTPNINQDFPHFFNTFSSSLTYLSPVQTRYGLKCLKSNVIVSDSIIDIKIYDITDPFYPQLISSISRVDPQNRYTFDSIPRIETTSDEKTLYAVTATTGVGTFDISNKSNPNFVDWYIFKNNGLPASQFTHLTLSPDKNSAIISNSFYGALLLHSIQTTALSQATFQIYVGNLACGIEKCVFTSDGLKVICACREVGTLFFTIGAQFTYTWQYLFNEMGSESLALNSNSTLLFIANGFQGLFILDISNFNKPVQLSQLILSGGWAQQVYLLFNEKYIIVAETDKGQLNLVNIEDSSNPYIQQKIQFYRESSTEVCIIPNTNSMFYLGNAGLRYQPILPNLSIHAQFQLQVLNSNGTLLYYQTLSESTKLLVGQTIKITFTPLYTEQNINVANVYYYRYFKQQNLPSWISYLSTSGEITMVVNKLGTQNDFSTEVKGENIILLEVQLQVLSSNLIKSNLITSDLAAHLISLLQQNGFLDTQGYVTDRFDPTVPFEINFYDTTYTSTTYSATYNQIQNVMKEVLAFSKIEYPIRFFIVSSLVFNYQAQCSTSITQIISTPSQQISIYLQINSNGIFVKKIFEGVLTSFSDDLTSVKISGFTSNVNKILCNSISISNSTADLSQVSLTFLLSDSNNYDQTIQTTLDKVGFISLHKPVLLQKKLSPQLNSYYTNGNLPIEDRFSFTFDQNSFTQEDDLPITYTAFILDGKNNSSTQILTGSWIEFNYHNLGFDGIVTSSHFMDNYWVRVIATDGYSQVQDDFNITFNQVPFSYAIQLVLQILGPIVAIIGLWKYRYQIHLILTEKGNTHRNEVAFIGKMFKKQIILYGNVQKDVLKLWRILLKKYKTLKSELIEEYTLNSNIDVYNVVSKVEKEYQNNPNKFPLLDPREFDFDDSRLVRSVKRLALDVILKNDKQTLKAFNYLKKHSIKTHGKQDWYRTFVTITPNMEIENSKVIHKDKPVDKKQYKLSNNFVNINQNVQNVDTHMKEMDGPATPQNNNEINNIQSSQDISSHVFLHKIVQKEKAPFAFSVMSQSHEEQQQPQQIEALQQYSNLNAFPYLEINTQKLESILKENKSIATYDLFLLCEVIALVASGTCLKRPRSLSPCHGESIHLFPYNLFTLSAFRKTTENNTCATRAMKKLFHMKYSSIGLANNDPLPEWMDYQIVDGILNIWGIPQPSDEEELMIRIINNTGFAIYNFPISIQDFYGNNLKDKALIREASMKQRPASMTKNKQMHSSVNILGVGDQQQQQQSQNLKTLHSFQHIQLPSFKRIQLQNIKTSSPHSLDQTAKQINNSVNDNLKCTIPLKQIEEERPELLKELVSVLSNKNQSKPEKEDEDSIIVDINLGQELEFQVSQFHQVIYISYVQTFFKKSLIPKRERSKHKNFRICNHETSYSDPNNNCQVRKQINKLNKFIPTILWF